MRQRSQGRASASGSGKPENVQTAPGTHGSAAAAGPHAPGAPGSSADPGESEGSADSTDATEAEDSRDPDEIEDIRASTDETNSQGAAGSEEDDSADDDSADDDSADEGSEDDDSADDDSADDDSEDGENSEDNEDSADDEDPADDEQPKTPMERLLALAERSCSLLTMPRDLAGSGIARLTRAGSAAARPLAAATVGSLALGLPHAHPAHPPFIPLVPMGPVLIGFSNDVLISGAPAALSGALGANPTCCGLSPFYEVLTGSAKVLINGEHAVRVLDLTLHCQAAPNPSRRAGAVTRGLRQALHVAEQAIHIAHKVEDIADFADQSAAAVSAARSAQMSPDGHAAAPDAARRDVSAAVSMAASMSMTSYLAEKAQDQLGEALTQLMGLDAAAPAGTPGAVLSGADGVLIGGLSVPSGSAVVRGLLRLLRLSKAPGPQRSPKVPKGPQRSSKATQKGPKGLSRRPKAS